MKLTQEFVNSIFLSSYFTHANKLLLILMMEGKISLIFKNLLFSFSFFYVYACKCFYDPIAYELLAPVEEGYKEVAVVREGEGE